jgi:predicted DNA-binding antitoxin AbrB/MazE fold protein
MTQIDAIYRGGVFQPLQPVNLQEEQRVRLSIDSQTEKRAESATSKGASEELLARLRKRHAEFIQAHGPLPDSAPLIAADRLR